MKHGSGLLLFLFSFCVFCTVAAELLGVVPEELAAALISNVNYLRSTYNFGTNIRRNLSS